MKTEIQKELAAIAPTLAKMKANTHTFEAPSEAYFEELSNHVNTRIKGVPQKGNVVRLSLRRIAIAATFIIGLVGYNVWHAKQLETTCTTLACLSKVEIQQYVEGDIADVEDAQLLPLGESQMLIPTLEHKDVENYLEYTDLLEEDIDHL